MLLISGMALADDKKPVLDTGDTAWLLTSTVIVLLMTIPGIALFYGGMVRKRNILATLMQSFTITCLVTVIWMVLGYSLAFSKGAYSFVGNLDLAFLSHLTVGAINGTIPDSVFVIFQATFAIITAALITGAVAERMKFSALLIFIGLWSIIVYSPITYWVWGGGFLGSDGVLDFAGGTVSYNTESDRIIMWNTETGNDNEPYPHNLGVRNRLQYNTTCSVANSFSLKGP